MTLEDLYRLLRSGHVQAQGVMDTLGEPLVVLDQGLCVLTANPAFLRVFRTDRDKTIGHDIFALGNGQWDIAELRKLLSEVVPKVAAVIDYEVSHDFPDIGRRTFLVTARRLVHPDDNSHQILVVFNDVTARRHEAEAQDILLNETRHRMKNLMAVVQALARRTPTEGVSAVQYRDALLGRLQGLLLAQQLTLQGTQTVTLEALLARVLEPYAARIDIVPGPPVQLAAGQVQPLGMIVHELATNAVKYGALSVSKGTVRLGWTTVPEGERIVASLVWKEENGPPVSEPDREGFGTGLIRHAATELQGSADLAFDGGGLQATIGLPVATDEI